MLPDYLSPNLSVIFCGTAAGPTSAAVGHYYAGPGNKFWRTVNAIGLVDKILSPEDDWKCLSYGFGFTDLAKKVSGTDKGIRKQAYDPTRVQAIVREYRPRVIAFNGKKAAQIALKTNTLKFGLWKFEDDTSFWILPSTSGAANGYWSITPWQEMAKYLRPK